MDKQIGKIIFLLLLLTCSVSAEWIPSGYVNWVDSKDASKHRVQIGGEVQNWQPPTGTWDTIDTKWEYGEGVYFDTTGVIHTSVTDLGVSTITSTFLGGNIKIVQEPIGVVFLDTSTFSYTDIAMDKNVSIPIVRGDKVQWKNYWDGISWSVIQSKSSVAHEISFSPSFLTSLKSIKANPDIALGNVIKYVLTGVQDPYAHDVTYKARILKKISGWVFELNNQRLQWAITDAGYDHPQVLQRWISKGNDIYCIEYVMLSEVMFLHEQMPSIPLFHNVNFTLGAGTQDCASAMIANGVKSTVSLGDSGWFSAGCFDDVVEEETRTYRSLVYWPVLRDSIYNRTVDACSLIIGRAATLGSKIRIQGVVRDWTQSQTTWNIAKTGTNWGTAGASNTTSDLFNSGGVYDSITNNADSIAISGGWYALVVTAHMQACDITDTSNYKGWRLVSASECGGATTLSRFYSDNAGTNSLRPKVYLYYTTYTPPESPTGVLVGSRYNATSVATRYRDRLH